ncbi:hypothetical protein EON81_21675 [bacterium]|nr:MAG: hypothetical protein EON81_21675 [bacterium]
MNPIPDNRLRARLARLKPPIKIAVLPVVSLVGCISDPATVQAQAAASVQTAQAQVEAALVRGGVTQGQHVVLVVAEFIDGRETVKRGS